MHTISVRNVHDALPEGLRYLGYAGQAEDSRNGKVIVAPEPVTTKYQNPMERVMFHEARNDNPFFNLMEALWMISGSDDVHFPAKFAKNLLTFSDDGQTLNGAYGHRWRNYWGYDQLQEIVTLLKKDPTSRRAVIGMWDAGADLRNQTSKDLPCNTQIFLRVRDGELDITVTCRSNDIIWGAYGANAFHFSFFQEFMAGLIGVGVGYYYQMSNNFHAYDNELYQSLKPLADACDHATREIKESSNPYNDPHVVPYPMFEGTNTQTFQEDLDIFMEVREPFPAQTPFFRRVVIPMLTAWDLHKAGDTHGALDIIAEKCDAHDLKIACTDWLVRRLK